MLDARPRTYEINAELVEQRKKHLLTVLGKEGIGRREVIEQETGRERLRQLVWDDASELSLLDRCQLIQELLHELAVDQSVMAQQ